MYIPQINSRTDKMFFNWILPAAGGYVVGRLLGGDTGGIVGAGLGLAGVAAVHKAWHGDLSHWTSLIGLTPPPPLDPRGFPG